VKQVIVCILTLGAILAPSWGGLAPPEESLGMLPPPPVARIEQTHVVKFLQTLPNAWKNNWLLECRGVAASDAELAQAKAIVEAGLRKYPSRFVRENLSAVYFVHQLKRGDVDDTTGTFAGTEVVVALPAEGVKFGREEAMAIEGQLHRQFAQLLHSKHRKSFPEKEWNAVLPTGFRYDVKIRNESKPEDHVSTAESVREGFVCRYAKFRCEEDIGLTAMNLFAIPTRTWEWDAVSLPFSRKLRVLMEFYRRLDPMMTVEYFKALKESP